LQEKRKISLKFVVFLKLFYDENIALS